MNIIDILHQVTVDCKDNQHHFTVRDRIDAIQKLLEHSSYKQVHTGNLCLIYAKKPLTNQSVILISSHIDCVYEELFCEEAGNGLLRGTFDNSLTNSCLLYDMLMDRLDDNVVIAFTGDEEEDSNGAKEVMRVMRRRQTRIAFAIVLDVTEAGWEKGCSFTIENDLGIDIRTGHEIIKAVEEWGESYEFIHDSEPDESWDYDEEDIPCLTLCIPISGDMHSDAGCFARTGSLATYSEAIVRIARALQTPTVMESKFFIEYDDSRGACRLCGIHTDEDSCRGNDYIKVMTVGGTLALPSEIHGIPVFGIEDYCMMDARHEMGAVRKLVIPSSYLKLGDKNFSQWKGLEEIELHCRPEALCEWNFAYCDNLKVVKCMNGKLYDYCMGMPYKDARAGYGCFDGCLEMIEFS